MAIFGSGRKDEIYPEDMTYGCVYDFKEQIKNLETKLTKVKELVEKLALKSIITDNGDCFAVDDYAGGNIDDAYYLGCDVGRTQLSREILTLLNSNQ